jgi:hypothetical protein
MRAGGEWCAQVLRVFVSLFWLFEYLIADHYNGMFNVCQALILQEAVAMDVASLRAENVSLATRAELTETEARRKQVSRADFIIIIIIISIIKIYSIFLFKNS